MSWNLGASASWNPLDLFRHVMGLLYLIIHTHFCCRLIRPQGHSEAGRNFQWKIRTQPSGIEPATFKVLAQYIGMYVHIYEYTRANSYTCLFLHMHNFSLVRRHSCLKWRTCKFTDKNQTLSIECAKEAYPVDYWLGQNSQILKSWFLAKELGRHFL